VTVIVVIVMGVAKDYSAVGNIGDRWMTEK